MKGFIVYPSYENINGETLVYLFGRLENGQSFLTVNKFEPYVFIKKKHHSQSETLKNFKSEETKMKNFDNEELIKLVFQNQEELNNFFKEMHKKIEIYEGDIKPHIRFLIDNDILTEIYIEGDYNPSERIDRIYKEPKIKKAESKAELKIVSLDIESDEKGKLFCIGLSSKNYKKNFFITNYELENTISCKSEEECLELFKKELIKQDPDIIIGWNVIDFDLVYLKQKLKENKIKFDIGRTDSETRLRIESNFFRSSSADVEGRQVLDGLNLIKDPFIKEAPSIKNLKFDSLTLEDVSQAILKKGKLMSGKGRHSEIEDLYRENKK
ncbi:MAG: 3'-5' exonuclease, partial [Nanoarchaeota archaeon]